MDVGIERCYIQITLEEILIFIPSVETEDSFDKN